MGCTKCHEVRVNRDITRVKLTETAAYKVCLDCHPDKDAAHLEGRVHPPAVRDCTKCHDAHATANKNHLLKPLSGASGQNLCLTCHNVGVAVPKDGSRHPGLDGGCDTCHVTHRTGVRGELRFSYHLAKNVPALCLDCHNANDAALIQAHRGQSVAAADCLACHDPHQSNSPKLLQAFLHAPFEARACDTCHQAPADGKVVLTQASAKPICVTCHDEQAKQIDSAQVQHPGAMDDCTGCHNPHGGRSPGFLKPDAVSVCLRCHEKQAEQGKELHPHQPAFEQGCATCHEPHGNDNRHLLRTASINQLCLECHGPDAKPQKLEAQHLVTIFGGKVKLPENYFAKVPVLPLKYGRGHPVERHPVSDLMDPNDLKKVITPMNCLSCHQPHAAAHAGLPVQDQANATASCNECHKGLITPGR